MNVYKSWCSSDSKFYVRPSNLPGLELEKTAVVIEMKLPTTDDICLNRHFVVTRVSVVTFLNILLDNHSNKNIQIDEQCATKKKLDLD